MNRSRLVRGLLILGAFGICALLLWETGLGYEPLFLMIVTGLWTILAILLSRWPWVVGVPFAALALAAPALWTQPLPVFLAEAFLIGGLSLLCGGASFLVRRQTSHRQAQQKLELSYGAEVFENSLNILHVIDREGNVIRRNRRSFELLGWPYRRTLHVTEYVHPEDLGHFRIDLERFLSGGRSARSECGSSKRIGGF
jgi:hypothetical protein